MVKLEQKFTDTAPSVHNERCKDSYKAIFSDKMYKA